ANNGIGYKALYKNVDGKNNTANGNSALYSNTSGENNAAFGYKSLYENTIGTNNTAFGTNALRQNTEGNYNSAFARNALFSNLTGSYNVAQGPAALFNNISGDKNVAIGRSSGFSLTTGGSNVFLGHYAGYNETGSDKLYISNNKSRPLLYGEFSTTAANNKLGIGTSSVSAGDTIKVWNGARLTTGGVWTNASSRELKQDIQSLSSEDAQQTLAALSPVRYAYKNSPDEEYVGFIAEDVPALVASNDRKSLSPMDVVAVLTQVTKEQASQLTAQESQLAEKDAEVAALEERMLQLELALTELMRSQSAQQVGALN
ncbi:MAG: hypothetical protein GY764_08090, partial [Halieaceae bacterium]|nr:hypothetical protein [Halieaceae bacterium]